MLDSDINDLIWGISDSDSIGTYVREINIPVEKEELGIGIFFMDVTFDGEEELLIEYPGYNRVYYACFDIVNGESKVFPGFLMPIDEEPYNNIVSTEYTGDTDGKTHTEIDYNKKRPFTFTKS